MIDIVIMKNPLDEWHPEEGDRQTDFGLEWDEVEEIQKFINVPPSTIKQLKNEGYGNYQDRLKEEYLKTATQNGYEMLGRIWYYYDDAVYQSSEVNQLRNECVKVINESQNSKLTMILNKILTVCDDAMKTNSGLFFGCD